LSEPVKVNVRKVERVAPPFAMDSPAPSTADAMAVSGGASTTNEPLAGVGSRLPEESIAATWKL